MAGENYNPFVGGYDPFEVGGAPIPGSVGARPKKRSVLDGMDEDLRNAIRIAKEEDERIKELVDGPDKKR